jgi:hypothetical protein
VASDYILKFELGGFKSVTRQDLVVSFGRDIEIEGVGALINPVVKGV